jgi:amino acid transporter
LISLNVSSYVAKPWHGTLFTIAIALIAILFNTVLAKRLPLVEGVLVTLHVLGIVIMIPLWILSPISKGGEVLTTFYNGGGYSTVGLSAMVGMFPIVAAVTGLDCSIHMGKYERIALSPLFFAKQVNMSSRRN